MPDHFEARLRAAIGRPSNTETGNAVARLMANAYDKGWRAALDAVRASEIAALVEAAREHPAPTRKLLAALAALDGAGGGE